MRTHYLNRLAISGREKALASEPDFDFYRAKTVLRLQLSFELDPSELPSLRLDLAYEGKAGRYALALLFEGVRELLLPKMTPSLFLPELEIEDVRERMMEGVHFQVISHFEGAFRCSCREITVLDFQPMEDSAEG